MSRSHRHALAFFLLLTAFFYAPVLLGLRAFPSGDFTDHFLPFSLFQQSEWLAGRALPLWNPHTYSGHPFLADVQAAVFYPLSGLLLLITLPLQSPQVRLYLLQVEALIHIALAGFFLYLLLHKLTGSHWAGAVGGATFAFGGYLTGYPPLQLAILRTAVWLPLILWLLLCGAGEPARRRWWVGAAVAVAVAFLAGHPQTFLHLAYAAAAWGALLLAQPSPAERLPRLKGMLAVLLLPIGLTAAQWLPSLEFMGYSVRAATDYAFVSSGFPLVDTWQLLLPGLLSHFSPLYVGIPALFLALHAIAAAHRFDPAARRAALYFAALAVVALLLAYGANGPLYRWAYRFAPGWDLFRQQERAAYLVSFGLSGLTGLGAAWLPRTPLAARRRLAAGGALLLIGALALFWLQMGRPLDPTFTATLLFTLLLVAATVALLWRPDADRKRTLLLALIAANLLWANAGINQAAGGVAARAELAPAVLAVQQALANGGPGRVYNEFRAVEDYGLRIAVEDTWGSSPLRIARYAALFDAFPLDRMWRLTAVSHVLTWRRDLFVPAQRLAEFPQTDDTTYLHRLDAPAPRVWLVSSVIPAEDEEALALLADHDIDLERVAVLPPDAAALLPEQAHSEAAANLATAPRIDISRPAPHRVRVQASSERGGLLLISENWLPGWRIEDARCAAGRGRACIDRDAPLRADLSFLAVPLPAGTVAFELRYWPRSLTLGLAISALSLLTLLAWLVLSRERTRG